MSKLELRCENCTAFLRVRPKGTMIAEIICSNSKCKHVNQIKVVNSASSPEDVRYKFMSTETAPKGVQVDQASIQAE